MLPCSRGIERGAGCESADHLRWRTSLSGWGSYRRRSDWNGLKIGETGDWSDFGCFHEGFGNFAGGLSEPLRVGAVPGSVRTDDENGILSVLLHAAWKSTSRRCRMLP